MTALFGLMAPPPRRIIEFGCGTGWLSLALAQLGYDVVGVDISADAIRHAEAARVARRQERARFVAADYETFATPAPSDYALFLAWAGRLAGGGHTPPRPRGPLEIATCPSVVGLAALRFPPPAAVSAQGRVPGARSGGSGDYLRPV